MWNSKTDSFVTSIKVIVPTEAKTWFGTHFNRIFLSTPAHYFTTLSSVNCISFVPQLRQLSPCFSLLAETLVCSAVLYTSLINIYLITLNNY